MRKHAQRRKRKLVPVSKLAEFADDPAGFRQRAGGTINHRAAAAGTRGHRDRIAQPAGPGIGARILIVLVLAALGALALFFFAGHVK